MNKKSFIISVFTVFVQYYDYHLFGFMAANIASHFFPSDEIITQLLNTYFLMAIAMIAKPLGSVIFGKIGDLKGRSNSFKVSLFGTSAASFILFIAPAYESVGILSAFILLLCRMSICAFVTSGSDGVRIYIYEHIPASKRCLGVGITTLFTQAGSLTASLSAWFFTRNYLPSYSWKFAFLVGGVLGILALLAMKITNFSDHKQMHETDGFSEFQNLSLTKIIRTNWELFLLCIVLAGSIGSTNQFLIVFFGTYNFEIIGTIERSSMQKIISLAIVAYMIFSVVGGYIADKLGPYIVAKFAVFAVLTCSILLCLYLNNRILNEWVFIGIATLMPFVTMPAAAIFKQSIPEAIRYRLFSLSHAIGSVLISAPTAFLSTFIYHKTNIIWLPIVYFICTIIMIFLSLHYLNKRIVTITQSKNSD